ncbi:hypothetical protein [Deinococcus sp. UYEF24]
MTGLTDAAPRATARALRTGLGSPGLGSPGLGSQALVTVAEPLTFQNISNSGFTDRVRRVRYIQASFKVTNTTASTFRNLNFVPVSLADTDGDASNNAMLPTTGGTPFSHVSLFDGSDASGRAADLMPGAALLLNPATGELTYDPAGSGYRTQLNVSQVMVTPPGGLTAEVKTYGWKVAPSLAPGESATVTFAVAVANSDPDLPKADPYTFSLVFTPVQDDPALAATGSPVDTGGIAGTLSDDTLYGGRLELKVPNAYSQTPSFTAAVSGTGRTDLRLNTTPPAGDFSPVIQNPDFFGGCAYSGTFSDSAAYIALYSSLEAFSRQGDPIGTVQEVLVGGARTDTSSVGRIYTRTPLVLKGDVNCFGSYTYYDVTLTAGWNVVDLQLNAGAKYIRTLSPEARSVLQVTRRTPGVTAALDDNGVINLKPGERVQRSATLLQVGGYSGTVRLSTNVPGVSVEPGNVNLASLGTQSLGGGKIGAQSLSAAVTFVATQDIERHFSNNHSYTPPDALIFTDNAGKELGRTTIDVRVLVPGLYASFADYAYGSSIMRGGRVSVGVYFSSQDGFEGPVTLSLAGLPDGVTASPQTVNVSGYRYTVFELTASSTAVLGTSTLTLEASMPNQASAPVRRLALTVGSAP